VKAQFFLSEEESEKSKTVRLIEKYVLKKFAAYCRMVLTGDWDLPLTERKKLSSLLKCESQ